MSMLNILKNCLLADNVSSIFIFVTEGIHVQHDDCKFDFDVKGES